MDLLYFVKRHKRLVSMHTISATVRNKATVFGQFTNLDQDSVQIFLCQIDVATFS